MTPPVLAFFNNKAGIGKATLACHLAWMFGDMGLRVLAADLDPQASLTSAFLDEDQLVEIWEGPEQAPNTIFRCIQPLLEAGDIRDAERIQVTREISLIPGDLALAGFEDELSAQWPASMSDANLLRPFRVLTAFWQIVQAAAVAHAADLILIDTGPNLGAINRSALVASDFVLIPLAADLFSIQGLRNLGPTLRSWRSLWNKRLANRIRPTISLPAGTMQPIGYVARQRGVRLSRPVKAYNRWLDRIPLEYRQSVLGEDADDAPAIAGDPHCLAMLKNYQSLIPMAMEARKPIFSLRSADGAIGAHAYAAQDAYKDYRALATKILTRVGLPQAASRVSGD